jgi:uncharacterized protein (TIGR02145 family)
MRIKDIFRISPVLIICLLLTTYSCKKSSRIDITPGETVTDIDGNVYHTIKIGTQSWMVENLNTTRYSNGDVIPEVTDASSWIHQTQGALCSYNNNPDYAVIYGKLYNWYAVNDSRKIAPEGWHVATDAEWTTLINYLGGDKTSGGKMKEQGNTHWAVPNTAGSNESGFTALPGGFRDDLGEFSTLAGGYWWSSTLYNENVLSGAWSRNILFNDAGSFRIDVPPVFGQSVRCIKD